MVHINVAAKSVTCKLVYYGPGFGGKTTNLEVIHARAPKERRGKLLSVATQGDRTLFFDHLPLDLGQVDGLTTKFQLYTVPGQVYYAATRKLVLRGVDGVVFVADSSAERLEENRSALEELERFVRDSEDEELGCTLPLVFQWNKRDLHDALSVDRLDLELNRFGAPSFEAIASEGSGVITTLKTLARLVIASNRDLLTGGCSTPAAVARPLQTPLPPSPPSPRPRVDRTRLEELSLPEPAVQGMPQPPGPAALFCQSDSEAYDPIDRVACTQVPVTDSKCPWASAPNGVAPSARRAADSDSVIGQVVRGCRIHTKLAEGGMGAVYLARHEVLEKDVVVKVLKPRAQGNPRRVQRFLREARLAASIEHPNVVTIQDVGTNDDGLHYILMQFVAGRNLHQLIQADGRQTPTEATRIVRAVTSALCCLHAAGVIHRDVKAENVVLTPSREVKLIDFGLAKDIHDDHNLTIPGAMIGTPLYMAPEIGRVAEVDGRADIYSLGLTYYYLLTGRQPYEGCSLDDILFRRVRLANPLRYAPDLPEPCRRVLGEMLAWERDDRYADALTLERDLDALLAGEPVTTQDHGPWSTPIPPTLDPDGATGGGSSSPPVASALSASSSRLVREVNQASEDPRNLVGARYLLLTELDPSGGLRLYRAWDTQDECLISLRIFDCVSAVSPTARRDMARAAKLRHPYLLPLRHSRLHAGRLYASMYPVRGHSLLGLSGPGARLRAEDVARVVRDVARALAHAHGKGLVHGGLQPDSVLVGPEGQGLLLDMGLGAVVRQATRGLPSRMCLAPECDGRAPPDARSDIYSLGVVLYQALCGEPPEGDAPLAPGVRVTGVLPELDAICLRCLAPDPEDRYACARDLVRDLDATLAGAVPRARSTRRRSKVPPARERKTEFALLASVTLLVLTGMLLVTAWTRADIMEEQAQRYESMLILLEEQQQRQAK